MKKKVRMVCVLKSGAVVKETYKADKKDLCKINQMKRELIEYLDPPKSEERQLQNISFGRAIIAASEVAAIKIY
jgi:hypothetical protein